MPATNNNEPRNKAADWRQLSEDNLFNSRILIPELTLPGEGEGSGGTGSKVEVKGIPPIHVRPYKKPDGTQVYEISYKPVSGPSVSMGISPGTVEYQVPASLTFSGSWAEGSSALVSKVVSPATEFTQTGNNYTFTKPFTGTQGGSDFGHSILVTDEEGLTASASASVMVHYRHYYGTLPEGVTLDEAFVKASLSSALGLSISQAVGAKTYATPLNSQATFVWLTPALITTDIPTPKGDGNFEFELVPAGTVTINNILYKASKTKTVFAAGGTTTLSI